jgi:hypothetical protein
MKNLKRASVLGGIVLSLVMMSTVEAQAQQGVAGRLAELQQRVERALATLAQADAAAGKISTLEARVTALEAALATERAQREAADAALQSAINAIPGGVTQAAVDAAVAAEAAVRASADSALEGQIANEVAAREALGETVASLGETVAPLASLAPLAPLATYVSVQTGDINGLAGPHVIFSGANVHIQNGAADSLTANGRGNLVVGYNEDVYGGERGGSHNVVIGAGHRYNFATGFVTGYVNRLGNMAASVSGGGFNNAGEFAASVTGGSNNNANGMYSTVTAGDSNNANASSSAVHGGSSNDANGDLSAVSGGFNNTATAPFSVVP